MSNKTLLLVITICLAGSFAYTQIRRERTGTITPALTKISLPTHAITGTVRARHGAATGAVVVLACVETGRLAQTETDEQGRFSFTASSGLKYHLSAAVGTPTGGQPATPRAYDFELVSDSDWSFVLAEQ